MKKIILIIVLIVSSIFLFTQCKTLTTIPDPKPDAPERLPLPHPVLPRLESGDNPIIPYFMMDILKLAAAIEKYEILVEIYEREYLNIKSGNEKYQDKSLEELKEEYYKLLGIINETLENPVEEEVIPETEETKTTEIDKEDGVEIDD